MDKLKKNEIAKIIGLNKSTIRYYEQIGLIHPEIDENNYRSYGIEELKRLSQISFLRDIDIDLEKINELLTEETLSVKDVLNEKHASIKSMIEVYTSHLKKIEEIIKYTEMDEHLTSPRICEFDMRSLYKVKSKDNAFDELYKENKSYFDCNNLSVSEWFIKTIDATKFLEEERLDFEEYLIVETKELMETDLQIPGGRYLCFEVIFEDNEVLQWQEITKMVKETLSNQSLKRRDGKMLFINKDNMHFNFTNIKRIITIQLPIE